MFRPMWRQWLGAGVLGSVLALGCSHSQRQSSNPYLRPMTHVTSMPVSEGPTRVVTLPAAPTMLPAASMVQVAPEANPATLPAAEMVKPVEKEVQQVSAPPKMEKEAVQASFDPFAGKSETVKRRSCPDITAKPCFAHSQDYSWLTGELTLIHQRNGNVWKLRYASMDEDDRFGGSVILVETGPMTRYNEGQCVRVEGQVVEPETRDSGATYRVRSIQVVSHQ